MLSVLADPAVWRAFYEYKRDGGHLGQDTLAQLADFIQRREYLPVVERILQGGSFAPPKKSEISKSHSGKKRVVYTYAEAENWVLKLLTFLLQRRYDHLFADNLYSFRCRRGVRDAVKMLTGRPDIGLLWCYKVDIRNYFNSVPVEKLLPLLRETLSDEPAVYAFLAALLEDPLVEENGVPVAEEKGIMAGTPISSFLANLYLCHMDRYFAETGAVYARYSDDVILFAADPDTLEAQIRRLRDFLAEAGLAINPEKEQRAAPGEMWTFLGICYENGVVDVAPVSLDKLKAKMRRKTRALVRWQARKGATGVQAAKAFIRVFNRKLLENPIAHELTWVKWYFPLINTTRSLQVIDAYSQSCIRYLATGKRSKAAYDFRYEDMKALGYVSLVNRYYKKDNRLPGERG